MLSICACQIRDTGWFHDASSKEVTCMKTVASSNETARLLFCSKSRVVPAKVIRVTVLELSACILFSELICTILEALKELVDIVQL